jgi:serine/threonine-protein kinase
MSQKLAEGTRFGAYTVQGIIAGGGMGQVYAAHDEVYGSTVALKVLHEKLHADDGWRARFNEEGLVGTQLKHPHVLSARELVQEDGRIALVLDLVPGGQTLEKIIAREFRQGLSLVQALQVFLGIVQGIEYLHGKGVVHGDLKPENVMIEGDFRNPDTWVPKVTDFGTVALIAHPVMLDGRPAVVATPRYASPEHLLGVDQIEIRSDIYSLGLILHFLLSGRHASNAQTVREAYDRTLKPVPMVALVDQPEALVTLFKKAVAVDPDERFPSCRELALGVRSLLDAHGVQLDLDDIRADLATEIDDDRAQQQAAAQAQRRAEAERAAEDAETELEQAPNALPDPAPVEPTSDDGKGDPAPTPATAQGDRAAPAVEKSQVTGISAASAPKPVGDDGKVPVAAWVGGAVAVVVLVVVAIYGWAG